MGQYVEHLTLTHGLVTGAAVAFVPVLMGEDGEGDGGGLVVPGPVGPTGPVGATGPQGPSAPALEDPQEGAEGHPIPGPPGPQGATGGIGPTGPTFFLDAPQGDEGWPGARGEVGAQGSPGVALLLDGEQGDDGFPIPGPQGPQGNPSAVGAAAYGEVYFDNNSAMTTAAVGGTFYSVAVDAWSAGSMNGVDTPSAGVLRSTSSSTAVVVHFRFSAVRSSSSPFVVAVYKNGAQLTGSVQVTDGTLAYFDGVVSVLTTMVGGDAFEAKITSPTNGAAINIKHGSLMVFAVSGATGATGSQGPVGPPVFLQADPGEDGVLMAPGSQGSQGQTGAVGPAGPPIFLQADPGEESLPVLPGPGGPAGPTGSQGPTGPPVYLQADAGEDGVVMAPGSQGQQGQTGQIGPAGPAVFLEAEPGEDGFTLGPVGPQGSQGQAGAAGPPTAVYLPENDAPDDPLLAYYVDTTFVGSGASHRGGLVPDPGATAYSNTQRALMDSAAFAVIKGQFLGYNFVATDQSTTGTSYADLTTADSVSFTLDVAGDVLVMYASNQYNATNLGTNADEVFLDGSGQASSESAHSVFSANQTSWTMVYKLSSVAAGAHTVKVQHKTIAGQTGHWVNRTLVCYLVG